jgi:tetratricopeptide (TPR) repeat protein
MSKYRIWLTLLLVGSISLGIWGCSSEDESLHEEEKSTPPPSLSVKEVDLGEVFELRIAGKTEDAIDKLRDLNEKYPASVEILVQLARSLIEAKQFSLAAFRIEQALSLNPEPSLIKESAEAHYLARDYDTSVRRYRQYLAKSSLDNSSQLRFARMLAKQGNNTESLNAFTKANKEATADDCILMGNLFLQKGLLPQAKHWFGESSRRSDQSPTQALVGLLKVAQKEKNESEAETIILAMEKSDPGILEETSFAEYAANLLRRRRLADFIARGTDARVKSASELASVLLSGPPPSSSNESLVTGESKLPRRTQKSPSNLFEPDEIKKKEAFNPPSEENPLVNEIPRMSLADAFAAPIGEVKNVDGASESSLKKGEQAYLEGSYTSALLHARDALKNNSEDALAWKLCSQAHFQLGETNEAEMTILEAIRHQPFDLDMRMDYLRIARETLSGKRYLQELEKVRDLFPQSTEILWELARRYHVVENMPVTAAVLYRKIIQIAPHDSSIAEQAEIELIKLRK